MKRVHDIAWPVVGLAAVSVSAWLLLKELRGLSLASLREAIASISLVHWSLAVVSTLVAYSALAWYDRIALLHLGRKIGWRFVALASFTAYAIAHNVGASVLSGAIIRYRAYSTKGMSVGEIGILVAFCSFTFALGAVTLGALLLLMRPDLVERVNHAPLWLGRVGGLVLLVAPVLYVVGSLLHFRPFRLGHFEFVYPRPPVAARQLLAGPLELIGAAGITSRFPRPIPASSSCSECSLHPFRWRWSATRRAALASWKSLSSRACPMFRRRTWSRRSSCSACSISSCR
jgi:glycosyltransferase 2 family protein